jgi:hypothetical protein
MCATAFNTTLRKSLQFALDRDADTEEISMKIRESLNYFWISEPEVREVVRKCYRKSTRAALEVSMGMVAGSAFFA